MKYQIKDLNGNWADGTPTQEGQVYRLYDAAGGTVVSFWTSGIVHSRKITQLAFLNRFTDNEAVDIDLASVGNTREAALLRRYLQKVAAATFIDLARPDLSEDLGKLVVFGLLSQERVTAILTDPIQEHERFKE